MKDKLYNLMSDLEDIIKELADMQNSLEIQELGLKEENDTTKIKSALRVQIRLVKGTREECNTLRTRIDDLILDVVHGRL